VFLTEFNPRMMAPGGVGCTGFPPRGTHPEVLQPTNPLVMWAFTGAFDQSKKTRNIKHQNVNNDVLSQMSSLNVCNLLRPADFSDSRWTFTQKYLILRQVKSPIQ
jgi:hypothetical protein